MLLISGMVRFTQELRAKRVADHLTGMISSGVLVRRNGQWVGLSSTELVVGDRVRLFAGDRVPADIRLTAANDLFVFPIGDHGGKCRSGKDVPASCPRTGTHLQRL